MTEPIPAFRPYRVRVARVQRLSPHFVRIIFTGDDLTRFGTDGYDQRIKLLLPLADGSWPDPLLFDPDSMSRGAWYDQWRALPGDRRYTIRTYTVRCADPEHRTVTVDFVVHDGAGPAGTFAANVKPGDEAAIVGPNAQSPDSAIGIDFHPGASAQLLLVGDETAVPAVGAILNSLLRDQWHGTGTVLLEVPTHEDRITLPDVPGIQVDWGFREGQSQGRTLIDRMDRTLRRIQRETVSPVPGPDVDLPDIDVDKELLWEVPEDDPASESATGSGLGDLYAWIAGEAAAVRELRRIVVRDHRMDRRHVAFMGYWRAGKAEE